MKQKLKIGFIGLGKMGSGICQNIQRAGFTLTVYNRTKSKMAPFLLNGAQVASSPNEVAKNSDIIFTSLMDDASVLEICEGEAGLFKSLKPGSIHIGLTTIQPETSDKLATLHTLSNSEYIAAPVIGRPDTAKAGELTSFLAGDLKAIDKVRELVDCYTEKLFTLGSIPSSASSMKICANYMAMTQLVMLGEIFTFAEKKDLNKEMILMMSKILFGGSEPMVSYAKKIMTRNFDISGFDLKAGLKDALVFEKAFNNAGVIPSIINIAKESLIIANANNLGNKDWSALTEACRLKAGLSLME